MSKVTRSILAIAGVVAVVMASMVHPVFRYQRARCAGKLELLGNAVRTYQSDHQGQLPHQLTVLSNELSNPTFLICPSSGHAPGNFASADSWADYTLVDWSVFLGSNAVPKDYPIAYDRFLSNHAAHGINVLTADGFVRWDANSEHLKKFATEHPDFKLQIPE